jgi:hypothetical protein
MQIGDLVPEWRVRRWLGGPPQTLESLRGKVVVVHAFQMLCPGCIYRGLPQAIRLAEALRSQDAVVLGLHTVFEHHDAMRDGSLEAFLHELRVPFPVGVDEHDEPGGRPWTMRRWGLRGTPSTVVVDVDGRLARLTFGAEEDVDLGLRVGRLLPSRARCETELCVAR